MCKTPRPGLFLSLSSRSTHRCTLGGVLLHDVAELRALGGLVLGCGLMLVLMLMLMLMRGLVLLGGGAKPHRLVEGGSRGRGVQCKAQTKLLGAEGLHGELACPCWWLQCTLHSNTQKDSPQQ